MLKLHVTDVDGSQAEIEGKAGYTLMEILKRYSYTAIEAACGGSCSCATCHVVIDEAWFSRLPPPGEIELELLSGAPEAEPQPTSRLSCQILLDEGLSGLTLKVAKPGAA